jgi:hypothetical protein
MPRRGFDRGLCRDSPVGTSSVDVTVTTPGGTSATSSADQFAYDSAPTVSAVSLDEGKTSGGTAFVEGLRVSGGRG